MNKKNIFYIGFTTLFIGASAIPFAGMFLTEKEEVKANQILAPMPSVELEDGSYNKKFLIELNDYISDNFAFKQDMINANAKMLAGVFKTSNTNQVVYGKDGYLFYADSVDDYMNIPTMTQRDAANAAISLGLMQEYIQAQGRKFIFTIAPNKASLYPQLMPDNYKKTDNTNNRIILTKMMESSDINYVNLFDLFDNENEVLYHKFDSHWNNKGAGMVQKAIMNKFGLSGTDYNGVKYTVRKDFSGDLYEMIFPMSDEKCDEIYFDKPFSYTFTGTGDDDTTNPRYEAENKLKDHALVMYRDSFGNSLTPFMAEEFGNSYFYRAVPYDLDIPNTKNADYVAIELVERHLDTLSTRAAIMSAPKRDISIPEHKVDCSISVTATDQMNYTMLTGAIDIDYVDAGSRIYAVLDDNKMETVLEATPVGESGENNANYTLYIPVDNDYNGEISFIITHNGEQVRTEKIDY